MVPHLCVPGGRIDLKYQDFFLHVGHADVGPKYRREQCKQPLIDRLEPLRSMQQGIPERANDVANGGGPGGGGSAICHRKAVLNNEMNTQQFAVGTSALQIDKKVRAKRLALYALLVLAGLLAGLAGTWGLTQQARNDAADAQARAELQIKTSQLEVNELAQQMSVIQAEMSRVNTLGATLVKDYKITDKRFDFSQPVGQGGGDPDESDEGNGDMPASVLKSSLATLQTDVADSANALNMLGTIVSKTATIVRSTLAVPLLNTYVTSAFGSRGDPIKGGRQFHKGIDFQADVGDTVMTVADGVVSYVGWRGGYGHTVEIDHAGGYRTRYAHNSRLTVKVGDVVQAGDQIAKAGSTGRSTGPHVHLEVFKDGKIVNPLTYLNKKPTKS